MTEITNFPAKRNVQTRVVQVEDVYSEFGFAVESLYPADDKSAEWNRRGVFRRAADAMLFAQAIQPD